MFCTPRTSTKRDPDRERGGGEVGRSAFEDGRCIEGAEDRSGDPEAASSRVPDA